MRRTIRVVSALSLAMAVALGGASAGAQSRAANKVAEAKALKCTFSTVTTGNWKDGSAVGEIRPAKLTIGFEDIDSDEGSAIVVGTFGPSDIIVRLSNGTLHLVQSFREGPLYSTTIFSHELRPNVLMAVHTRHEFTTVQLPGFTSRPEQYYGECEITK